MSKPEMTLSEFREKTHASDNGDGTWSVLVPLSKGPVCELTIERCSDEYDAYERGFLYMLQEIEKANKERNGNDNDQI